MPISGTRVLRLVAILVAFAFVASACTSGSVFDSTSQTGQSSQTAQTVPIGNDPGPNPSLIVYSLDESAAVTATIDASGGEISAFRDGVEMTLVIPEGALLSPTEIRITPVYDATSDLVDLMVGGAEFSPSGLFFVKPALFRIRGAAIPDPAMAVTWVKSGGEVTRTPTPPEIDDGVQFLIGHFSGAGVGSPGPGASSSSPRSMAGRGGTLINDEWRRNDLSDCIDSDNPAAVTAINYYIADAEQRVIPALKKAQSNDMVLIRASRMLIEWWAFPELLTEPMVCDDLRAAYLDVRDGFSKEIGERLTAGFVHAVFEASRQCQTRTDRGEIKHMLDWTALRQLLEYFTSSDDSDDGVALMSDAIAACALYRVELRAQLTLNAGVAGKIRGTIAATADDVPDTYKAGWLGAENAYDPFPFNKPSYKLELPPSSGGCVYVDNSKLNNMTGIWLVVEASEPERKIPGLGSESAGDGEDEATAAMVIEPLEGSGAILVECEKRTFPMPFMATLIPQWFNRIHRDEPADPNDGSGGQLRFDLSEESGGSLVASFISDEPIVDPNDPSAKVEQHTEVKVFHTPKKMSRQEPAPPPDVFP